MSICSCPSTGALPTIPAVTCPVNFGQIQKVAFQRLSDDGKFVGGTSGNPIEELENWQDFLTATDDTKIAVTPYVEAPTAEGGDARTFGGGNDTPGGVETIVGSNPVTMSFTLRQLPQSVIKELKKLMCEKKLGVYFFNGDKQVLAIKEAGSTTNATYRPIPIQSFFVGDLMLNGFDTPDSNEMSFGLKPNWSDDVEVVTLGFDPLIAL